MNKRNSILFFIFSSLLLTIGVYIYFEFANTSDIDIEKVTTNIKISSEELTSSFINNEGNSNLIFKDKIIEVFGVVKEVTFLNNRNTVILHGNNKYSGVLCDVQSYEKNALKQLEKGDEIRIKGVCKGFLQDAILLNCMLINQ